ALQAMALPSSHSQLRGKVAGKDSGGLKFIEFCIVPLMPVKSGEWNLPYSAPMRVAPANAADCLMRDPKSAAAAIMRRMTGAITANSAATVPRQPSDHRARSWGRRPFSLLRLTAISFGEGCSVDRRPAA